VVEVGRTGAAAEKSSSNGVVLLVDDDPQVRAVASKMLEMQGFDVITAADGEAGVELFRRHAHEVVLVVLDLAMPVMDGKQAFREMIRVRPDVRVVLSSGYDEARACEHLSGEGLAGFIQKPYRLAALREVVRGLVDGSP
jgi:DNA-binding NtrC family response regulator